MIQFFARVVELREEKYVKYDGKITLDSLSRDFLEMTCCLAAVPSANTGDVQPMQAASRDG